ncbi:MAG: hypothetical protein WBP29_15320 [Candidatus Zixiibacteriota bacterium]
MHNQSDYTGNKFLSKIPDTDEPTRVHLVSNFNRQPGAGPAIWGILAIFICIPLYSGWKTGGLAGAWQNLVEVSVYVFPYQMLLIIPLILWYYGRNRGAYFFRTSIVKGSRLTRSWMLSWKSSLYSEITKVTYDSTWKGINFSGPNSKVIMRLSRLDESEEALLWPLIQSKIGIDKLDRSATQRSAEVHDDETRKRGWKQTLIGASLFIVLIAYVLWRLTHLD